MTRIDDLMRMIPDIPVNTTEKSLRTKSRDYFFWSPILKEKLDHIVADAVVSPRDESDVSRVLSACWELDISVTPRGGGTGNYGQAMPLDGGVVLDMMNMNRIKSVGMGTAVVEPGTRLSVIEEVTRPQHGLELRMYPSTLETASIGGFIAGGSGGVGSIRWGMLREPGNILKLRLSTMEQTPRCIELTGDAIDAAAHAYGVNGVITEVELSLAPAYDWVEMLVSYRDWNAALEAGWAVTHHEGLWLKELAAVQQPAPHRYFTRYREYLEPTDNTLCILVAPNAVSPLLANLEKLGGRVAYRSDKLTESDRKGLTRLHHLTWNHTTLQARKVDPDVTYLQVGIPVENPLDVLGQISKLFRDELIGHVEFVRASGRVYATSLPLLHYKSPERLLEISQMLEDLGCTCYNPHTYRLEEGSHRGVNKAQLELKKDHDPKGLLNPGKMIAWENEHYEYDLSTHYPYEGLQSNKL